MQRESTDLDQRRATGDKEAEQFPRKNEWLPRRLASGRAIGGVVSLERDGRPIWLRSTPNTDRLPGLPREPSRFDQYHADECPACHGMGWMSDGPNKPPVKCTRRHAGLAQINERDIAALRAVRDEDTP